MDKRTFIRNWIAKKRASLPYGVLPLKYIESNGQQWIDTGIDLIIALIFFFLYPIVYERLDMVLERQ